MYHSATRASYLFRLAQRFGSAMISERVRHRRLYKDIWICILNFLQFEEVWQLRQVSREWSDIIEHFWEPRTLRLDADLIETMFLPPVPATLPEILNPSSPALRKEYRSLLARCGLTLRSLSIYLSLPGEGSLKSLSPEIERNITWLLEKYVGNQVEEVHLIGTDCGIKLAGLDVLSEVPITRIRTLPKLRVLNLDITPWALEAEGTSWEHVALPELSKVRVPLFLPDAIPSWMVNLSRHVVDKLAWFDNNADKKPDKWVNGITVHSWGFLLCVPLYNQIHWLRQVTQIRYRTVKSPAELLIIHAFHAALASGIRASATAQNAMRKSSHFPEPIIDTLRWRLSSAGHQAAIPIIRFILKANRNLIPAEPDVEVKLDTASQSPHHTLEVMENAIRLGQAERLLEAMGLEAGLLRDWLRKQGIKYPSGCGWVQIQQQQSLWLSIFVWLPSWYSQPRSVG